ncbi:hypothetical protein EHP00_1199 [Ecytonucleospora hepatopenaei]|uniref:Uncharacterized protein n=1 Tax=Ecytonucleospora hepatopenaei TaxID=646526 RepID=A0A1W0E8A8_9MICR|nr:hypothetical protein EHP00_1199 [Ecytonucleospora hepatopenaei]
MDLKEFYSAFCIYFCKSHKLPSNVKSTVLQLLTIIDSYNKNILKLSKEENGEIEEITKKKHKESAIENPHFLAIFMGAKAEEIQENMIDKIEKYTKTTINKKTLIKNELAIANHINFNFVFMDVYAAAFGMCVELSEKEEISEEKEKFRKIEENLDKALCTEYSSLKVVVFTAINMTYNLKSEICENYQVSPEEVEMMSKTIEKYEIPSKTQVFEKYKSI